MGIVVAAGLFLAAVAILAPIINERLDAATEASKDMNKDNNKTAEFVATTDGDAQERVAIQERLSEEAHANASENIAKTDAELEKALAERDDRLWYDFHHATDNTHAHG